MARQIPLTQGMVAIVDDDDYERISQYKWAFVARHITGYATARVDGSQRYMHRIVVGAVQGQQIDHINRDGLDNRRDNLRLCNPTQSIINRNSPYLALKERGVRKNKDGTARARIGLQKKYLELGTFPTIEEAARAYDAAARDLHGEFAVLNYPDETARPLGEPLTVRREGEALVLVR